MTTVTFDTLKFVRTLELAGVSSAQAEAFSTAVQNAQDAAQLATKADVNEVRAEIHNLRKDLINEIKLLEKSMTIKLGSMIMASVGLVVALIKLL